jgi:hypothetical protein
MKNIVVIMAHEGIDIGKKWSECLWVHQAVDVAVA